MPSKRTSPRDYFRNRIERTLIGPGADIFGLDDVEEILAQPPLEVYASAILFPEKTSGNTLGSEAQLTAQIEFSNSNEAENILLEDNSDEGVESENSNNENKSAIEPPEKDYVAANHYFPNNFGISFCIAADVQTIGVTFTAGMYEELKHEAKNLHKRKAKVSRDDFWGLMNMPNFPFSEVIAYDDTEGCVFFTKHLDVRTVERELRPFREMHMTMYQILVRLSAKSLFKRTDLQQTIQLSLNPIEFEKNVFEKEGKLVAKCFTKVIASKNGKTQYVKILLKNCTEAHPANRFSVGNEDLNKKCLFQVGIEVKDAQFEPYKETNGLSAYDEEANVLNYQYRKLYDYAIGHGCAAEGSRERVSTTFLPQVDIPTVSQDFREGQEHVRDIAQLRNLSIWSPLNQSEVCQKLGDFVEAYSHWITEQAQQAILDTVDFERIPNQIVKKQRQNLERLQQNVQLLQTNQRVYDCFCLANTAMLIQMIVSRDTRFGGIEKHLEDFENFEKEAYKNLDFFKNYTERQAYVEKFLTADKPFAYRPFQLAFLLLNLESVINPQSPDRNDLVDLLWFPTGGGKTEAYLAITAFTILWRRIQFSRQSDGVSVIMRYTLRLLTAQQFERAARLICALDFMRQHQTDLPNEFRHYKIGLKPISIGMWVGGATSPNKLEDANKQIEKIANACKDTGSAEHAERLNIFQITACPFCGCRLITKNKRGWINGFSIEKGHFKIICPNSKCTFSDYKSGIPLDVVDESLYKHPPTLLFATVDKFAQIPHRAEAHRFFNSKDIDHQPPDLIIQDELHLLNGPLGSVVGLFETMVEMLSTRGNQKSKIIASTATTRNTDEQVGRLYNRKVNVFPPAGIEYDDSYFSRIKHGESRRRHIGFMPTGKTAMDTQVRGILPALFMARLEIYKSCLSFSEDDKQKAEWKKYWTIVSYYNSLKDVGKIYNKVSDEILTGIKKLQRLYGMRKPMYDFNHSGFLGRTAELTSRIQSDKIKSALKQLERDPEVSKFIDDKGAERWKIDNVTDLVLASNMFSVGIDIGRLNVMLMNGQPKNVAEYIQASSRVARNTEGVVINLLDANRAREKSYFEHYVSFHQAYYRFVEPLTVTPFTEITFQKTLNSLLISFVRHITGLSEEKQAHDFKGQITDLINTIVERIPDSNEEMREEAKQILENLAGEWEQEITNKVTLQKRLEYKDLLTRPNWQVMNSMRETDTTTLIEIEFDPNTQNKLKNEQEDND